MGHPGRGSAGLGLVTNGVAKGLLPTSYSFPNAEGFHVGVNTDGKETFELIESDVVCFRSAPADADGYHSLIQTDWTQYALPPLATVTLERVQQPGEWEVCGQRVRQRLFTVSVTYKSTTNSSISRHAKCRALMQAAMSNLPALKEARLRDEARKRKSRELVTTILSNLPVRKEARERDRLEQEKWHAIDRARHNNEQAGIRSFSAFERTQVRKAKDAAETEAKRIRAEKDAMQRAERKERIANGVRIRRENERMAKIDAMRPMNEAAGKLALKMDERTGERKRVHADELDQERRQQRIMDTSEALPLASQCVQQLPIFLSPTVRHEPSNPQQTMIKNTRRRSRKSKAKKVCSNSKAHVVMESQHTTMTFEPNSYESTTMLTMANVESTHNRCDLPNSSIGGQTTCIVCMEMEKTHLAVPCGHQTVCFKCSKKFRECPYCRESVHAWVHVRVV